MKDCIVIILSVKDTHDKLTPPIEILYFLFKMNKKTVGSYKRRSKEVLHKISIERNFATRPISNSNSEGNTDQGVYILWTLYSVEGNL